MKTLLSKTIIGAAVALTILFNYSNTLASAETTSGSTAKMPEIIEIQREWARLNYLDEFKNNNYKELQTLAKRAFKVSTENPGSAEALVWDAIVLSTLAAKKGGLGALSLVKEAKLKLEKAEEMDARILQGAVYTSLGTLYAKVPGWPIGFGSDKKAQQYFDKALAINPNGLDINYFFAEFLAENNKREQALLHLDKALTAPELLNRPIADRGRREQALKLRENLLTEPQSLIDS